MTRVSTPPTPLGLFHYVNVQMGSDIYKQAVVCARINQPPKLRLARRTFFSGSINYYATFGRTVVKYGLQGLYERGWHYCSQLLRKL